MQVQVAVDSLSWAAVPPIIASGAGSHIHGIVL